ncbi:MAG TPA: nucleotide pyrophosphohydrolase [Bdellovibrionales bacterium]|nr:nucleotide pyrophosphohydrolase [Bdellovibrionales bacterium]
MDGGDRHTSLEQAKEWVQAFCEERGWDPYHGPKDLAIGLVTEGSELLELFRFVNERECMELLKDPAKREMIADELADSIYFILRFSQLYGFDLSTALKNKITKNARKYPAR